MNKTLTTTEAFNYIEIMCRLTRVRLTPEQYREMIYWDKSKIDDYFNSHKK